MKLLALDTSTARTSIAISQEGKIYTESCEGLQQQSHSILPLIEKCLAEANLSLRQLDGIVFGSGPGGFTGLRVACSIAKGLAMGVDLPLYPVSSMQAIAQEVNVFPVLTMLDARMRQVYWSYFSSVSDLESQTQPIIQVSDAAAVSIPGPCVLAGVDFMPYLSQLPQTISQQIVYPSAPAMIKCVQFGLISAVDAAEALPIYIRGAISG
jgi:tRNA threonylcarbamoyladenosine biosynthesis protein TsaB